MPLQVIRIYLAASPDLKEEKRLLLEVLEQLNYTKAAERNVFFKLVNPDPEPPDLEIRAEAQIARSDLFVLMLGKSWEGGYGAVPETAPIEQKFKFAQSAFKHSERPRLLIYFRSVLPYMMADPGFQLRQIIGFRDAIEASRQQFSIYDHPLQWRDLFNFHLSRWLDNPQDDSPFLPVYLFSGQVNDSLSSRLRDEYKSGASPDRRRALNHAMRAVELLYSGRFTAAEEYFSQALDIDDDPEVLHSFGVYLQHIGSLDRAETIFQRLLTKSLADEDVDPSYQSLALANLGLVYAQRAANEPTVGIIGAGSAGRAIAEALARGGWKYVNLRDSLGHLPYATSRNTFAHGLATAFRSKDTEPFGQMVSRLYYHSPMPPRVEVLRTLVSNVGGASAVAKLPARGSELAAFGGLSSRQVTEREAAQVAPEGVRILATHAEQKNPSTIDKISLIYSGYPEIVKSLGPKPLSITLSSMAEREAANPRKVFFMNYAAAEPREDREARHVLESSESGGGSAVFYMGTGESTEEAPPISLVANSWFEDENRNAVELRTSLITGQSYKYFFAIEKVKRDLLSRSDLFKEPYELATAGDTKVQLEVICPLLVTKNRHKIARRTVRYYSGTGIRPQSFPLHAGEPGDYLLTIRVFYIRRLLYRAVVPINVAAEELRSTLATADLLSRSNEMARGDHV